MRVCGREWRPSAAAIFTLKKKRDRLSEERWCGRSLARLLTLLSLHALFNRTCVFVCTDFYEQDISPLNRTMRGGLWHFSAERLFVVRQHARARVCMRTRAHTRACARAHPHTLAQTRVRACICTHKHACVYVCLCVRACVYVCVRTHTYTLILVALFLVTEIMEAEHSSGRYK
jgi:hypothetical protein